MLSVASQRLSLKGRYKQVVAMTEYLLISGRTPKDVLGIFYLACGRMSKYEDYLSQIELWRGGQGDKKQKLLTEKTYAFGLELAEKYQQAEQILQGLTAIDRGDGDEDALIYRQLAGLYEKMQKWPEMILAYGRFITTTGQIEDGLLKELQEAARQIRQKDIKFGQWIAQDQFRNSYANNFLIGYLAEIDRQSELAKDCYRRAVELKGDFAAAQQRLAELLLATGGSEEVLEMTVSAENTGQLTRSKRLLYAGRAYATLGLDDRAAEYYRELIDLQEDTSDVYLELADVLCRRGDYAGAEEILLEIPVRWPGNIEVYRHLLKLYCCWNAQADIEKSVRSAAEKRARQMMGLWLRRSGDIAGGQGSIQPAVFDKLVETLERLAKEHPSGLAIGIMLAELYSVETDEQSSRPMSMAIEQVTRLMEYHRQDEKLLVMASRLYRRAGDLGRAAEMTMRLWQMESQNPSVLASVLELLRLDGQVDRAIELITTESQTDRLKDIDAMAAIQSQVRLLFAVSRRYAEAVELFEIWFGYLEDNTDESICVAVAENLLWSLTEAGEYDRAIELALHIFERFDKADSDSAAYLSRMLNIRLMHTDSLRLLEGLLKIRPDEPAFRICFYLTMTEMDRQAQAVECAKNWLAASGDDLQRRYVLMLILQSSGHYVQACDMVRGWLTEQPDNRRYSLFLAGLLRDSGDCDGAWQLLDELADSAELSDDALLDARIKVDIACDQCQKAASRIGSLSGLEDRLEDMYLKSQIFLACGDFAGAIELQERILAKRPDSLQLILEYTGILGRAGRSDESIEHLERLLESYPNDPGIKNNLGYSFLEAHRDTDRAHDLIAESLDAEPYSAPTLDSMGWYYYKNGQFQKAIEYIYQAAAGMIRPDAELLDHLGDTAYRLDSAQQAEYYWQRAIKELAGELSGKKFLQKDIERIENKLRQLGEGVVVEVATLFSR